MEQFKKVIEKSEYVLKRLANNAYDCFFTGETVRKIIEGNELTNVEVSTNASIDAIDSLFPELHKTKVNEFTCLLEYQNINFIIKSFKLEYFKNKKDRIEYRKGEELKDELYTRTFTVDSLAMTFNGRVTDLFDGYRDVERRKIRLFGNGKLKLQSDPFKVLEAMVLVSEDGYQLEYRTFSIFKHVKSLKNLTLEEMLPYIDRILNGKYLKQAFFYLYQTKLYKQIPVFCNEFKALGKHYQKIDKDMIIAKALTRNGEVDDDVLLLTSNPGLIRMVVDLAIVTPKSQYEPILMFNYGKVALVMANLVNAYLGKTSKRTRKIEKEYETLPIKKVCDLKFKGDNILSLYPDIDSDLLVDIVEDVKYKVIVGELNNDYDELRAYVINNYQNAINPPTKSEEMLNDSIKNTEANTVINIEKYDYDDYSYKEFDDSKETKFISPDDKFASLEKRMAFYEKQLQEKELKINALEVKSLKTELENDINLLMEKDYYTLSKMNISPSKKEAMLKELNRAYKKLLISNIDKYHKLKEEDDE